VHSKLQGGNGPQSAVETYADACRLRGKEDRRRLLARNGFAESQPGLRRKMAWGGCCFGSGGPWTPTDSDHLEISGIQDPCLGKKGGLWVCTR
jgi:hypothetical protein